MTSKGNDGAERGGMSSVTDEQMGGSGEFRMTACRGAF